MRSAWSFALVRLAVAIAIAALLGLVTGRMALWLTIVLGGILAWQFVNLFRLQRWLKHRAHEDPPDIGGVWGDVIAIINRIYRRKQFHKRRVTQQFREFRRLSAALPDGVVLLSRGTGDPLVQPDGRGAARPAPQGRHRHPDREPGARPGIRGLPAEAGSRKRRHRPRAERRVLARNIRHTRGPAVPDARARRDARDQAAGDAQGFRRERLARASLAAHGDLRLPRRARRRCRRRAGMARTGRGHAPPGPAHARDRRGPARALAPRGDHGRGPDDAGGRAGTPRAARARNARGDGRVRRTSSSTSTTASRFAAARRSFIRSRRT